MGNWKLQNMTLKEVRDHKYEVAILPTGALEPHNLHLPYGTDTLMVEKVVDAACEQLARTQPDKVLVLPPLPYGVDSNVMGFPGTVHMPMKTLTAIIEDILISMEVHGIYKFLIVNGHGGNSFKAMIRDTLPRYKSFVSVFNWLAVPNDISEDIKYRDGDHADIVETSVMMHLFPELVHFKDADDGEVKRFRLQGLNLGWAETTRPFHLCTTNSGIGSPRGASAEKGRIWMEIAVGRLSHYLKELVEAELDKEFPF